MAGKQVTVLLVEDDARTLKLEQHVLEREGYRTVAASSGEEALDLLADEAPDLVLLDVGLPGINGFDTCQRIREFSAVPVIMVTGRDEDDEKVQGLDTGADDYITKPFSVRELAARARATLRRASGHEAAAKPVFQTGDLIIDFARNRVLVSGKDVILSDIECRLLTCLARNAGRIMTPDQIINRVWGEGYLGESHLLHVTISRLRQKLELPGSKTRYIQTRRGIGYSLLAESPASATPARQTAQAGAR